MIIGKGYPFFIPVFIIPAEGETVKMVTKQLGFQAAYCDLVTGCREGNQPTITKTCYSVWNC
jgi:hypothetical protein